MKFSLAFVSTLFAAASAAVEISSVKADSKLGLDILSKSRRVEGDAEEDQTWIANMSIKFMGCHHISQWNSEAEDAEDVKIESKRLAKFRLCPSSSCSSGCKSGYGDYIVDMDDFLASYLENKQEVEEASGYYAQAGGYYSNGEQFELANYLECSAYEFGNNNGRKLAYYNQEYYVGTYCSSQGGSVVLGLFTDDACTNFADSNGGRTTFYQNEGKSLPYSDESIVDSGCWSCSESNGNGYYEPKQVCTDVYDVAGKCESNLSSSSGNYNTNTNACSYMSGIRTTSSSGIINSGNGRGSKVASAFISIFGISFVALGSYVYYLKTKLDRGRINLSD